jgi:hypothetical protein
MLILFEEYVNKRNLSITSRSIPTFATDTSPGGGLKDTILSIKHREEGYVSTDVMGLYVTLV